MKKKVNDLRRAIPTGSRTLPEMFFRCEEVWDRETELIFGKSWLAIGSSKSLNETGDYFRATVNGRELFVLKGKDGIRCFHNTCRHRGTLLVESPSGNLPNACAQCAYHAWRYNELGELIAAPNMREVDGFKKGEHALGEVACQTAIGQVFVNLSSEPEALDSLLSEFFTCIENWQLEQLIPVRRMDYNVAANWKLVFQNYNECYHCPTVHPALSKLTHYKDSENDLEFGVAIGGPMKLADGADSMTTDGKLAGKRILGLSDQQLRQVRYYSVFPNLLVSTHPDYVMIHRLARQSVNRTRVTCEFFFTEDSISDPGFDPASATEFWDSVNRQDWHVCELSQQGIESGGYRPGPYSDLENLLAAFDRFYRESLGDECCD